MQHVHHIAASVSRLVSMRCLALWAALGGALLPLVASAAEVIDFETIPGGTPADGLAISTQFQATHGVTFSLEGGGSPVLAKVGSPRTAFQGFNLADDTPAPGQNVGQFFLTDDGIVDRNPPALIITYSTPVAAPSGVLIDIDGPEEWRLEARDASNRVLDDVIRTPTSPNAGEGLATPWSFTRPSADIHSIRIAYMGPTNVAVGLAFDNFSSSGPARDYQFIASATPPIGSVRISAPPINGVLQKFESGETVSYTGVDWDPDGGSINVSLDGQSVGSHPAASEFNGDVGVVRLPEASSSVLDQACRATLTARQGTTGRHVTLQGTLGEEVVLARNINVVDIRDQEFGEAHDGTVLCEGERGVGASTGDAVLVTRSLGRPVQGGDPDLFPNLEHPYPGLWVTASTGAFNANVSGLWGRAFFKGGGTTYEQVALAAPTTPGLLDPRPHADYEELDASYPDGFTADGIFATDGDVHFFGHTTFSAVGSLIWVKGNVYFGADCTVEGFASAIVAGGAIVFSEECSVSLEHFDDPQFITLLAGKGVFFGVPFNETVLAQPAAQGDTTLDVATTQGFVEPGDDIVICPGCPNEEQATVSALGSLILEAPLAFDHAAGEPVVLIEDTVPPVVTCRATPSVLWPPNHRLVPVTVQVDVADGGSGPAGFVLRSATSSEPDAGLEKGDKAGDIQGWAVGTADTSGALRAERSGKGKAGRAYTLTYEGRDTAGNTALCQATVTVPHD